MVAEHATTLSLAQLLDPEVLSDPYPLYRRLREAAPLHWDPYLNVWLATDYATAVEVLQRYSARRVPEAEDLDRLGLAQLKPIAAFMVQQMLFLDPPQHNRVRAIAAAAFTPRRVERLRAHVTDIAESLIDVMVNARPTDGDVDIMRAFAYPLPAIVMAETLGVPREDWPRLKSWSQEFADMLGAIQHNPSVAAGLITRLEAVTSYFHDAVRRQVATGGDSLAVAMASAEVDGERLSEDEVVANLILTMVGGYETTSHLIGSGLLTLLGNPEQFERLRHDHGLMPSAVEELLRVESPIQHTARIAPDDAELAGRQVRRGQAVIALLGSANRDPAQFTNPDTLDLSRADNRHLAFGWAGHFCFGAALARLEGAVALGALLRRLPDVRLATSGVTWRPNPAFRGPAALPVKL
jgi:hypothetical protein